MRSINLKGICARCGTRLDGGIGAYLKDINEFCAFQNKLSVPLVVKTASKVLLYVLASLLVSSQAFAASAQATEKVLWSFGAGADGMVPSGNLAMDSSGNLYGTTANGGDGLGGDLGGTVFKLTPAGLESVLWSFGTGFDGSIPLGGVIVDQAGNLYGTTSNGGLYDNMNTVFGGTAFKLTSSGQETILWNFGNGTDGWSPQTGLVADANSNLFGGTSVGGAYNAGIAFELTPSGQESILWNFGAGTDGSSPSSSFILDANGNLYGTTAYGGTFQGNPILGHGGTIFKLTPLSGAAATNNGNVQSQINYTESVLWNFGNGADGQNPNSLIIDRNGNLFGTTANGGAYGLGTVFELTPGGQETVLWNFGNGSDGQDPVGVIMDAAGNLYGATFYGGIYNPPFSCSAGINSGCGTAFKLTPPAEPGGDWSETILWNFGNDTDASNPSSGLVMDASGNLYGETAGGGANFEGTLYELSGVNPSGQIALSAHHIQFPKTVVGGSSSVQLAIRNTGSGQLTGRIAPPPAPFGIQSSRSFNLAPRTQTTIILTFTPTAAKRAYRIDTVRSNSKRQSTVKLDLCGIGIADNTLALNRR